MGALGPVNRFVGEARDSDFPVGFAVCMGWSLRKPHGFTTKLHREQNLVCSCLDSGSEAKQPTPGPAVSS